MRRRMSAYVQSAKVYDRIANQYVYTFAVCLGNHTQLESQGKYSDKKHHVVGCFIF